MEKQTTRPIVIERVLNASSAAVWKAITDKEEMKNWYFDIKEFIPRPGFEFKLYGERDGIQYPTSCKIIELIPEKKLSYTWSYDHNPAQTIVSFELFKEDNQTRLKLTHEGLELIPPGDKNLDRENFVEGWNYIIGTSLKNYIEKAK
jgi:uncharacterized protein YndB with AHSA1/START domain